MVPIPKVKWTIYLSPEDKVALETCCELYGKTPSEIFEEAIEEFIAEAPRKPQANVAAASKRSIR